MCLSPIFKLLSKKGITWVRTSRNVDITRISNGHTCISVLQSAGGYGHIFGHAGSAIFTVHTDVTSMWSKVKVKVKVTDPLKFRKNKWTYRNIALLLLKLEWSSVHWSRVKANSLACFISLVIGLSAWLFSCLCAVRTIITGQGSLVPFNTIWRWLRPISMPSFIVIHPAVWRAQQTWTADYTDTGKAYGRRTQAKPAPVNFECVGLLYSFPWGSWIPI